MKTKKLMKKLSMVCVAIISVCLISSACLAAQAGKARKLGCGPLDFNADGVFNGDDAKMVFNVYMQYNGKNPNSWSAADLNCDQQITPADARIVYVLYQYLEKYSKGKINFDLNEDGLVGKGDTEFLFDFIMNSDSEDYEDSEIIKKTYLGWDLDKNGELTPNDARLFQLMINSFPCFGMLSADR